jgi:ketosteroid isomerase-like protein
MDITKASRRGYGKGGGAETENFQQTGDGKDMWISLWDSARMSHVAQNDIQKVIRDMFAGVSAKNVDAAVAHMSDDIELFDPHYPYPDMHGKTQVREGLAWAFDGMASMGFDIDRWFFGEDGTSVTVEVSTHHVLKAGNRHLDFPQVFVFDVEGAKITRMRAYEPYGPGGGVGFGLGIGHRIYRLTHRR